MAEEYEYLKKDPFLYFSQGSKELFHSNVLYWLSVKYKDAFEEIMQKMGADVASWGKNYEVHREYRHFDLCVTDSKKKVLFILENKIKTLPDLGQLKRYSKASPNTRDKVLLCIERPEFDEELLSEENSWKVVTYSEYVEIFRSGTVHLDDKYLCDYNQFLNQLTLLARKWLDSVTPDACVCALTSEGNAMYSCAKDLGLNDMYSKLVYSKVLSILKQGVGEVDGLEWEDVSYFRGTPVITAKVASNLYPEMKGHHLQIQPTGDGKEVEYKYMDVWDSAYASFNGGVVNTFQVLKECSFPDVGLRSMKKVSNYTYQLPNETHKFVCKYVPKSMTVGALAERMKSDIEVLLGK